ncbi:MarR family winged helix-turn-helix transcriptional regulator [Brachybacterium tyrofermentans]|uniref:MarR family winged helix-turn-helix transcriptional regulator n=1 Tax=Brachybacterium tyrofermentans TaxID=47848 RepID=UPI003FCFC4B3
MDAPTLALHRTTLTALTALMSQWSSLEFQRRITAECGVSLDPVGVRALYVLGIAGGAERPSVIADDLHLTRPSTSKLIARLTAAGLVERTPDSSDGRSARIALTADGRRTYEQLVSAGVAMLADATSDWEAEDVRTLSTLLVRFTDGLLAPAPAEGAPSVGRRTSATSESAH